MNAAPRLVEGEAVVRLVVNGEERRAIAEPRMLLCDFLRHELGLTGTHVGCEQGVCGACTVRMDGEIVRSCLLFAVQAVGSRIETIEGLASGDELHPVQQAYHEVRPSVWLLHPGSRARHRGPARAEPGSSEAEIREHLAGNVCRCTGYVGIVASVRRLPGSSQDRGNVAATETELRRRAHPAVRVREVPPRAGQVRRRHRASRDAHAAFLRSPFAHAKVTRVDAAAAQALDGVRSCSPRRM